MSRAEEDAEDWRSVAVPDPVEVARAEAARLLEVAGGWDREMSEIAVPFALLTLWTALDAIEAVGEMVADHDGPGGENDAPDLAALAALGRLLTAICEQKAGGS